MEASQTLPVVAESYGKRRIPAIADDVDLVDPPESQNLLADVDLTILDKATVATPYKELQAPDLLEDELDFPEGQ